MSLCRKTIIESRVNYWFLKKFLNFVCLFFDRKFIILLFNIYNVDYNIIYFFKSR